MSPASRWTGAALAAALVPPVLGLLATPALAADSVYVGGYVFERQTQVGEFSRVFDLYGRTAGGEVVALTNLAGQGDPGYTGYGHVAPAPNPGGTHIASLFFEGAATRYPVVFELATGQTTSLYDGCTNADDDAAFSVEWLADGRLLVYGIDRDNASGAYSTYVVARDGSGCQRLADDLFGDGSVTVSHDGTQVAYSETDGQGDSTIYVAMPDGTGARAIASVDGNTSALNWSPNGTRLVLEAGDASAIMTLTVPAEGTATPEPVAGAPANASTPAFTPDGGGIVYNKLDGEFRSIGLFELRGDTETMLTDGLDLYARPVLSSQEPQPRPAPQIRSIDDACPEGSVPPNAFADVASGSTHERAINCVAWWEITQGRTATQYEPRSPVLREQMARFVARMIEQAVPGTLSDNPANAFTDDDTSFHHLAINQLAEAGIVSGTGDGRFNPKGTVTRAQMAKFLANAAEEVLGEPLVADGDYFDDDAGSLFEADINRVASEGITGGAFGRTYDPAGLVLRDSMASFLARSLDLLVDRGVATVPS